MEGIKGKLSKEYVWGTHLLIIHIINLWLFIYVFYMCTSKYVRHIT